VKLLAGMQGRVPLAKLSHLQYSIWIAWFTFTLLIVQLHAYIGKSSSIYHHHNFLCTVVRHLQADDNLDKQVPFALTHPIKCSPEMRCYISQKHL